MDRQGSSDFWKTLEYVCMPFLRESKRYSSVLKARAIKKSIFQSYDDTRKFMLKAVMEAR